MDNIYHIHIYISKVNKVFFTGVPHLFMELCDDLGNLKPMEAGRKEKILSVAQDRHRCVTYLQLY